MAKVFVSYQQADRDFAGLVKAKLESDGIDVWLAEDALVAGQNWRVEIDSGISTSDALVVIMTDEARRSEYVTYEWAYAIGVGITVIPILLRATKLHPRIDVLQYLDFRTSRPWPVLLNTVRRLTAKSLQPRTMQHHPNEIERICQVSAEEPLLAIADSADAESGATVNRDVFVVVDVQRDFCQGGALEVPGAETLIAPLNRAIARAHELQMTVVSTRDWHPRNHRSFKRHGGVWEPHCVVGTPGAEYHEYLFRPSTSHQIDVGVEPARLGYSPYENSEMDRLINNPSVRTVYVAGIAFEYCVQATARETILRNKRVVVCESLIRAATTDETSCARLWAALEGEGIERASGVLPFETVPSLSVQRPPSGTSKTGMVGQAGREASRSSPDVAPPS